METKPNYVLAGSLTAIAVVVATIAAFFGSGTMGGTPVSEAAGGALSADATPLAPAGPAFSIWSVIYTGLVAYAIYQLLPSPRRSPRQISLRPWAAASALLNAAWIWVVQLGSVTASVVVIVLLLLVLIRILFILVDTRSSGWLDLIVTDGTFGLYLGWVCVATVANTAAWIATWGIEQFPGWQVAAGTMVFLAAAIGLGIATWTCGRIAPSLAISWGLAWIAVGRTSGTSESLLVVWSAGLAAAMVLAGTAVLRARRTSRDSKNLAK